MGPNVDGLEPPGTFGLFVNMSDERIDDLQYKGLRLIQSPGKFCFGLDAVLLADFAEVKRGDRVLDIGTGTGIAAILVAAKKAPAHVTGLELMPEMADMAARSVAMNGQEAQISIVCGDIRRHRELFEPGEFDAVITNPPYIKQTTGVVSKEAPHAISRHEIECTLEDVLDSAARLLKPDGRFTMVHRPDRLADIICGMRKRDIEPKWLRFVAPKPDRKPNLILIRGVKFGRSELKMLPQLNVYDASGKFSDEIEQIYCRSGNEHK